ncbi:putative reverse transcriptase, RNA-dependent DNA polymerase [Tanacetum coccineum]
MEDIEEEEKSLDDWDRLLDFNLDDIPLLGEEELPPFVCKIGKSNRNKKRAMKNLNFFYQDIGTSSSAGGHLTQEEAAKEALKDKVKLDGKIVKEEEEEVKRIKGEALKEKHDPESFIFPIRLEGKVNENALADTGSDINTMPYRIYEQLGREEMKKVDRGITMINHTQAEAMGILTNVLCQVGVTTLIAKFLILDIPIDRDAPIVVGRGFLRTISSIVNTPERLFSTFDGFCHQTFRAARSDVMRNTESDSDDEEEYEIKRNKFGALIYGLKPVPYLNCNDPAERSLAIQIGCYTKEEEATGQWRTEIRLIDPYGNIYLQGFTTKKTDKKLSKYHKLSDIMSPNLWEHTMMRPDHQDPNALDNMKPWKRYCSHKFIISSCYGKDATEMQSRELCHEFYSTYEFDKVYADDELQTKKIIKFRLGGRAHNLTLLEFARRLGLYHADELEEDGINGYFEGGLRSDEHFNAHEYWKSRVLTDDVIRSLSALIYYRDLDTTLLRDLIDSEGRLIPEDPQPGVPRVGIPRPPRASMQDLYYRMGRMEIRQEAIERIEYRQSYH